MIFIHTTPCVASATLTSKPGFVRILAGGCDGISKEKEVWGY
jgi:hypothetical protein